MESNSFINKFYFADLLLFSLRVEKETGRTTENTVWSRRIFSVHWDIREFLTAAGSVLKLV